MNSGAAPAGVATVSTPSPPTMEVPSVLPVVAGVAFFVDPQIPDASAAVKVSVASPASSTTALADVLPGWVADAAARGVALTSVYVVQSPAARRRCRRRRRDEPVPASGAWFSRQS